MTTTETSSTNLRLEKRIFVICQVFHPDQQSTSQLLSDVIRELAGKEHAITVLCGFPGVATRLDLPGKENWDGVLIHRGGFRTGFKRDLLRRALAYLGYSAFVVWRLLIIRGSQRILVVTNPPFLPVLVWLGCVLRGHQFKVMLQDIYPDGMVAVGRMRLGGIAERLWWAANYRTFSAADEIWVLGRDMAHLVQQRYRVPSEKIRYIPHWSAICIATRKPPEESRMWSMLKLQGKFVVQYSGNMGLWHDLETIVRAAVLLRNRTDIIFLLIGQGMRRESAEQLSKDTGVTNILWLPYQKRETLADSLICCHVALISQRAGLEGVAVPCKLYGILASGRAVVAQVPYRSEVAMTVEEEQCGRIVVPGDAEALAAIIVNLAEKREETNMMGVRAHEAYRNKYVLSAGVLAFERGLAEWPVSSR